MSDQPSSSLRRGGRPVRWLLAALLSAELLVWWLLRTEQYQKLGLGWQFWTVVAATVAAAMLVAGRTLWLLRHRFQFGLRTLLLSVLIVGTVLGLIGMRLRQSEKQRRAAAALDTIGARVYYTGNDTPGVLTFLGRQYFQEPVAFNFQGALSEDDLSNISSLTALELLTICHSPLSDGDLRHFSALKELRTLALVGTRVTGTGFQHFTAMADINELDLCQSPIDDIGLESVSRFKKLEVLNLNATRITDAGLAHLAPLDQLSELWLDRTAITGHCFVELRSLRNLQKVSLSGTQIGNDGLEHLQVLPHLVSLNLVNTGVDDDGIEALGNLSGLRHLALTGTGVSEDGLQRLRHALPNCVINHSSP